MAFDWTILLMLPGLVLGLIAQAIVKSAYNKYAKVPTGRGLPAQEAVRQLLEREGLKGLTIQPIAGQLTDHYNPGSNTLSLSQGVYGSASVAAVGVAAHEAGHALQKAEDYPFLSLRTRIVPVVNIGSNLAWPLFVFGLAFSWAPLMYAGIGLFSLVVLFTLITLPEEFDASRRARLMLENSGWLTQEELRGVSRVLTAAAMTYVASFVGAALQLLRLLLLAQRRRR